MDYQFTATVIHFVESAHLGSAFSRIYSFTNLIAVLAQLLLTRLMLTRLGVGPTLDCDVVQIKLSELRLKRPRQWGACWLACEFWDQLRLDTF